MTGRAFTLFKYYLRTQAMSRWASRMKLEKWQEKQVRKQVSFVLKGSPFYSNWAKGLAPEQWREFPVLTKEIMMEHFDKLNTVGIRKEEAYQRAMEAERSRDFTPTIDGVTIGLSSGTSGHRGLFLISEQERAAWAGTVLAKVLPGPLWKAHRIAFFLRADSNLYGSVRQGRLQFNFFDLLDPLDRHVRRLNEYAPTILVGPPSLLRMLAEAVQRGELAIRPAKIVSVAEVLDPLDEIIIGQCFSQKVHQVYQCTEGFLAATCPHGTLHLNEDIVYFEKDYLDRDQRKFVPILTDFSRTTQPLIRYRLNDILTEKSEACPCGSVFTALEQIEGRCDDMFYLVPASASPQEAAETPIPVFPDFIRRAVLACSGIEEYAVVQHQLSDWEVSLKLPEPSRGAAERQIRQELASLCEHLDGIMPQLRFTRWNPVQAADKKLKRVERRFLL